LRCPTCSNKVLHKSGDKIIGRFKGAIVFDPERNTCKARCHFCKSDVDVPITLKPTASDAFRPEIFVARDLTKSRL
jgi:hypothetical protein